MQSIMIRSLHENAKVRGPGLPKGEGRRAKGDERIEIGYFLFLSLFALRPSPFALRPSLLPAPGPHFFLYSALNAIYTEIMLHVGLTGGIASGKSHATRVFAELGAHVIDGDKLAHDLMAPGRAAYDEIVAYFGPEILHEDGTINRKVLAEI